MTIIRKKFLGSTFENSPVGPVVLIGGPSQDQPGSLSRVKTPVGSIRVSNVLLLERRLRTRKKRLTPVTLLTTGEEILPSFCIKFYSV